MAARYYDGIVTSAECEEAHLSKNTGTVSAAMQSMVTWREGPSPYGCRQNHADCVFCEGREPGSLTQLMNVVL